MESRRSFLKTAATAGAALILCPTSLRSRPFRFRSDGFAIHPFIEANPDAVFVLKTSVDMKTNAEAIKSAALGFGRSVFVAQDVCDGGIPITDKVAIKPNLTCRDRTHPSYTVERSMGIVTDAYFVEGVIEAIKELGLSGSQFYLREVNCPGDFQDGGYWAMAARTGADMRDLSAPVGSISENNLQWVDLPQGVWFRKIPYLWPINAPNTLLLNIAKLKTHYMGMTLAAKNLQGSIAHNYQAHCTRYDQDMSISAAHMNPTAKADILANYNRRVAAGIPRWDRPGTMGGLWMETWGTRCLDNNMVTHPGLHIIEGVYGRDGHFMNGPSLEGLATDYMTNVVIFGKNPFNVDVVGCWLGGHEPGNFGLFHMAIERGLTTTLNPAEIPVYEWALDGCATLTALTDFARTPLKTLYLRRDYNGQTEDTYHLVDEYFDYGASSLPRPEQTRPELIILSQNYPNPFNSSTSIQFTLPETGNVRIDVCDLLGQVVDVLAEGRFGPGSHLVAWDSGIAPTGIYFCRMLTDGVTLTKRMVLVR
jgi:uncharacterized protein (DUF362 family)